MNKEQEKIIINYDENSDYIEIFNSNGKTIYYGSYWDFNRHPDIIKEFLENCGLTVELKNEKNEI